MLSNLVTGGAGFIGSHLTEHLLSAGEEVVVWDDLSTGSLDNLRRCQGSGRLTVVIGDITRDPRFAEHVARADALFHLAAVVGVERVLRDPIAALRRNLGATEAACAAASCHGTRFLLASSSEVYGKSTALPLSEQADTVFGPTVRRRWCYGVAKAADEHLVLSYVEARGLRATVVRLFNTAGPRQSAAGGMVLPRFVAQARGGGPLTVYGDGLQRRCFSHVKDVAQALRRLINCPGAEGEVVNLGSAEEVSVIELARRVATRVNPEAEIRLVPYDRALPTGFEEIPRRVPDLSRARALIGYEPRRTLDDIITDILIEEAR